MKKTREGPRALKSAASAEADGPISHVEARGVGRANEGAEAPARTRTRARDAAPRANEPSAPEILRAGDDRPRVVLVTDDPLAQIRVVRALETAGHAVRVETHTAIGALIRRGECEIVLVTEGAVEGLDVGAPQSLDAFPRPHVLLLTHAVSAVVMERALALGGEAFLLRQGDRELDERIRACVALYRAERALATLRLAQAAEQRAYNGVRATLAAARATFHELRNVLVVVELGAHALLREKTAPADSSVIIASIDEAAQRMRKLFTELDEELGEESEL